MKRREFITLLGGAAATWPMAARAQPAMPVVGWLSGRTSETDALVLPAVRQALNSHGYVEGKNFTFAFRWADGQYERLPALATELVRMPVNLLIATGLNREGYLAAINTAAPIPVIFIIGGDPVKVGLVASFNRPGGNATGVSVLFRELGTKRFALMHELVPSAEKFAFLVNPNSIRGEELEDIKNAAHALSVQINVLNASNNEQIGAAFSAMAKIGVDALLVATDALFFARANLLTAITARFSMPALYVRREFVAAGGLVSYGSNSDETFQIAGEYAARILAGAKPGDLPVQQPVKLELVINLKTARALKLEVPPTLLARTDEVIE